MNCFDCIKAEHAIDPCHRTYQQLYDDAERWGRSLTRRTRALRRLGRRYLRACGDRDGWQDRALAAEGRLASIENTRVAREKMQRELRALSLNHGRGRLN